MKPETVKMPLSISVIVPAYRASAVIGPVLAPLLALRDAGEVAEVLVIDDCSPDDTAEKARSLGARVMKTDRNCGPAGARNEAARHAVGDILWFVDSDVIAAPGGPAHLRAAFADPTVSAVFGSYDDAPDAPGWFSRYKNLTHRFYHQTAPREASTFWAGCGAVRTSAFRAVGGFDAEAYPYPSIEDIELGYRLRANGGRIVIVPEFQGKHLKNWRIGNSLHTDIFRRALPWSRLIIAGHGPGDDLNTGLAERARALLAGLLIFSLLLLPFAPALWLVTLGLGGLAIAANYRLFAFFRERGGTGFALGCLAYHQVYYVYASAVFVWCLIEARLSPGPA